MVANEVGSSAVAGEASGGVRVARGALGVVRGIGRVAGGVLSFSLPRFCARGGVAGLLGGLCGFGFQLANVVLQGVGLVDKLLHLLQRRLDLIFELLAGPQKIGDLARSA